METSSRGRQAMMLAADGRAAEALVLLDDGADQDDGEALFVRGLWRVEGLWTPRDLAEARRDRSSMPARSKRPRCAVRLAAPSAWTTNGGCRSNSCFARYARKPN